MNFLFVLCMNNGYRNAFQQAKCDEPALAIRETIIFESERRASEDILCVNEVDVVSLQIASTFPRIPRESHMRIVYTNLATRKRRLHLGRLYHRRRFAKAWPEPDFR